MENKKCDECGSIEEVFTINTIWAAWGRNAFDFNWAKYNADISLCEDCEDEQYMICFECETAIDNYDYGRGYLPEDYEGDILCPECAENNGFKCQVHIGLPPQ